MPRELARLDRVEWVLRRTKLDDITARCKREQAEGVAVGVGAGGRHRERGEGNEGYRRDEGVVDRPVPADSSGDTSGMDESGERRVEGQGEPGGTGDVEGRRGRQTQAPLPNEEEGQSRSNHASDTDTDGTAAAATAAAVESAAFDDSPGGLESSDADGNGDIEQEGSQVVVARLTSIFEFLRRGRSSLLPPDLRVEWDARPDLGLALLSAADHHCSRDSSQAGLSRHLQRDAAAPKPSQSPQTSFRFPLTPACATTPAMSATGIIAGPVTGSSAGDGNMSVRPRTVGGGEVSFPSIIVEGVGG